MTRYCSSPKCTVQASFGNVYDRIPKWCKQHAPENENVNVTSKKCEHDDCSSLASWGALGDKSNPVRRCFKHKLSADVNPYFRQCEYVSSSGRGSGQGSDDSGVRCTKSPSYGIKSGPHKDERPRRCRDHKLEGDEHWYLQDCIAPGCSKHAYYGYVDDHRGHNRDNIDNSNNNADNNDGISNHGAIVRLGERPLKTTALWCKEHVPKQPSITNTRTTASASASHYMYQDYYNDDDDNDNAAAATTGTSHIECIGGSLTRCSGVLEDGITMCSVTPSYVDPNDHFLRWCAEHKTEGSRYFVKSKYCLHEDCDVVASYGIWHDVTNTFLRLTCSIHATEDMIHFQKFQQLKRYGHIQNYMEDIIFDDDENEIENDDDLRKKEEEKRKMAEERKKRMQDHLKNL